ncbi:hypothetical protein T10_3891 [Trichinella papuae]|uniref:Secreted protein n=1 Tax=Trichinella papuae TaxID=268474 RepID=A0A0V1MUK7_9BILA|nr:hypothetical protein T10_3891 [Trichinella papuae]
MLFVFLWYTLHLPCPAVPNAWLIPSKRMSDSCDNAPAGSRAHVPSSSLSPCRTHSTTFRRNSKC